MNIPQVIKVNANTITVVLKPKDEIDSEDNGGWAHWERNVLYLANDIPEDRQAELFLHEILHFVNVYLTEEQVTYLSGALLDVMRRNKINFL